MGAGAQRDPIVVEEHDPSPGLADEWDALADRIGGMAWVRPGWIEAWHASFGAGARLRVLTARRSHELVGALPLLDRGAVVRSPTNWHTPEFEILGEAPARAALAGHVISRRRPRRFELAFAAAEGAGLEECHAAARTAGSRVIERELERSPYVPMQESWEAFERTRDPRKLKDLDRRFRRLGERGEVELEVHDGSSDLDALLEEVLRLEGSGWKTEQKTAIASRPETLAFYTAVARWASARGQLRLLFLTVGGRRIAAELMIADGRSWYDLKGGYEAGERQYSPGKQIARLAIRRLHEEGLETLELLGDEEPWKLEFTDVVRSRRLLQVFAPTPAGVVEWTAYRHGRPLAKRALRLLRR